MDHDQGQTATWVRLVDICGEAAVSQATGLRWVRGLPEGKAEKRPRESGGRPEWWIQTDAAEEFLQEYTSVSQASVKRQSSVTNGKQASEEQPSEGEKASVTNDKQVIEHEIELPEEQASDKEQASVTNDKQASDAELVLAHVETRLARIEGALTGQWVSELSEKLGELSAANEGLQQELITAREEAVKREEALSSQLAIIQETARQEREALRGTLDALHQELMASRETTQRQEEEARHQMAELAAGREEAQRKLMVFEEAMQRREAQVAAQMAVIQEALSRPWWKRLWPWGKGNLSAKERSEVLEEKLPGESEKNASEQSVTSPSESPPG